MCVRVWVTRGQRRSDEGGKKLSVAPAIEVPSLCLVRPLCARTYTHSQSLSLLLVREEQSVGYFRSQVGLHLSAGADIQTHT